MTKAIKLIVLHGKMKTGHKCNCQCEKKDLCVFHSLGNGKCNVSSAKSMITNQVTCSVLQFLKANSVVDPSLICWSPIL